MNNLIDELFGQALDKAVPETWSVLGPMQLSNLKAVFAELLIKDICRQVVQPYMSRWPEDCALVTKIKQHYGVE